MRHRLLRGKEDHPWPAVQTVCLLLKTGVGNCPHPGQRGEIALWQSQYFSSLPRGKRQHKKRGRMVSKVNHYLTETGWCANRHTWKRLFNGEQCRIATNPKYSTTGWGYLFISCSFNGTCGEGRDRTSLLLCYWRRLVLDMSLAGSKKCVVEVEALSEMLYTSHWIWI